MRASGGPPEPICEKCGSWAWDWSPDRRWLLVNGPQKPWTAATIVDVEAKTSRLFLERPNEDLFNFEVSPDGRWIVFRAQAASRSRTYVAAFSGDQGPAENSWIQITDGSTMDDKMHWSPDGRWIYALSRSGRIPMHLGISGGPADQETRRAAGGCYSLARRPPLDSQRQSSSRRIFPWRADKIVFNQGEITGNIWMTEIR